jgi:hypothetical protein
MQALMDYMVCYLSLQVLGKFICHTVETTASPNGIAPVGSWWSWDAKVINWCCNPCGYGTIVQNEHEFMKFLTNPLAIWFVYSVYMHVVDFFASYSSEWKCSVDRSMAGMIWQRPYGACHQLPEQREPRRRASEHRLLRSSCFRWPSLETVLQKKGEKVTLG